MSINDLDKNSLYLLSVSGVPNGALFTKIITLFTQYKTKLIKNYDKPIVTHTAILVNHNNFWYIHEVDIGGEITKLFTLDNKRQYFCSLVGKITNDEKEIVLNRYSDKKEGSFLKLLMKYPFLKAAASYELPNINYFYKGINKILNYTRDIYESTLKLLGLEERKYCVESALSCIRDINYHRLSFADKKNCTILLNVDVKLLTKIKNQNYRLDEIYPQDIIENLEYFELKS